MPQAAPVPAVLTALAATEKNPDSGQDHKQRLLEACSPPWQRRAPPAGAGALLPSVSAAVDPWASALAPADSVQLAAASWARVAACRSSCSARPAAPASRSFGPGLVAGQWLPAAQRARIDCEHQRACSRASVASGPLGTTDRGMGGRRVVLHAGCPVGSGLLPAAPCAGSASGRTCSSRPFTRIWCRYVGKALSWPVRAGGEPLAGIATDAGGPGLSI